MQNQRWHVKLFQVFRHVGLGEGLDTVVRRFHAALGGDLRALEIDLEKSDEGELERLAIFITHRVCASRASARHRNTYEYQMPFMLRSYRQMFKTEFRVKVLPPAL